MTEIITVRFKRGGKQYFFDPQGQEVQPKQAVIVETSRGNEFGECILGNHMKEDEKVVSPLRVLVRIANEKDIATVEKNQQREQWARKVCMEKIKHHKLDMKLVGVEYSFEGNKVLFFFTSDGRVDFRGLVKDLAATIHARIELRQIGVRDEAKMVGGLGICGRPFCCNQFLDKFAPVSIKMAKTQSLSLNPTKISGTCGRLMCCLKYEQDAYEDLMKTTPRGDSFVETPDGAGTISAVNLLRQQVSVRLESDPTVAKKYHNCEIVVVRSGKGRRPEGYVEPPLEELEKQRRIVETPVSTRPQGVNSLATTLEAILNAPPSPPPKKQQKGHRGKNQEGRHENRQDGRKEGRENRPKGQGRGQGEKTQKGPKNGNPPQKSGGQNKGPNKGTPHKSTAKGNRDGRDWREGKENKEGRENREPREGKENKEGNSGSRPPQKRTYPKNQGNRPSRPKTRPNGSPNSNANPPKKIEQKTEQKREPPKGES